MSTILKLNYLIVSRYMNKRASSSSKTKISDSLMILIKSSEHSFARPISNSSWTKKFLHKLNFNKDLGNFNKNIPIKMEPVIEQFGILWIKSFSGKLDQTQKYIILNKIRIPEDHANDIEEFLMKEFVNSKQNIFHMHLALIEYFQTNTLLNQEAGVLFLNRTFESWWKQQINRVKKCTSKNGEHLSQNCSEIVCLCTIDQDLVIKAFDLVLEKNINLLGSMNKIYKFEENVHLLKPKIDEFVQKSKEINIVKLINELKLNDSYNIDYEKVTLSHNESFLVKNTSHNQI